MSLHQPIHPAPVIATGATYAPYLFSARLNIVHGLRLAQQFNDVRAARCFQAILDTFDVEACDLHCLIDEANMPGESDPAAAWCDHVYNRRRDLGV